MSPTEIYGCKMCRVIVCNRCYELQRVSLEGKRLARATCSREFDFWTGAGRADASVEELAPHARRMEDMATSDLALEAVRKLRHRGQEKVKGGGA